MRRRNAQLSLALLALTALAGIDPVLAGGALPTGGSVVSGGASISSPNSRSLAIQQSTQNAIVNWQGFSIGQGNAVNIHQPSSSSALLNRVTSSAPSTIAGQLNANGQVYLVNPNGIAITKTGAVKAAGFVASTLGIGDDDFRNGKHSFKGNGASAAVSNAGTITVGRGGYAALLGGTVSNSGTISAPLGKVGLGSGEVATIDLSNDGFLQVAAPTSVGGKMALIQNAGTIKANGGRVVMSAATAREAARNAVNISGIVQARSISGHSGAIVIGGGAGGGVDVSGKLSAAGHKSATGGRIVMSGLGINVSGKLNASGTAGGAIALNTNGTVAVAGRIAAKGANGAGGRVTITGAALAFKGARVNASGATGGGAVSVKGSKSLALNAATIIKADATTKGNGGAITAVSLGATSVHGKFDARGGPSGGDGGKVETSGADVDFNGARVNTLAPGGEAGSWLINPTDITIDKPAATAIDANLATTNIAVSTPASGAALGDIAVASAISWASPLSLTLDAAHAIAINAPITIAGAGKLNLIAAADQTIPTLALLSFGHGDSVQYTGTPDSGQALSINGQAYTLLYSLSDLLAVNKKLNGDYALAKPLNASGTAYTQAAIAPGPNGSPSFSGAFEGLGNTISNLTISDASADYVGLFGDSSGTIAHLGLIGGTVSGADNVGALAGFNSGAITQSYATSKVIGALFLADNGDFLGGLVGSNIGTITNSYATGTVSGDTDAGGLVGNNGGSISRSYASGAVSGYENIGGLVGWNSGSIAQSYAAGPVSAGSGYSVGGLVGYDNGSIAQSYATGAVGGDAYVGGLVGANDQSGVITQSYATGPVSGDYRSYGVGGLIGENLGSISLSFATGIVSSGLNSHGIGGLAGWNNGSITRSYATGAVNADIGDTQVGGLVGWNGVYGSGTINNSYATGAVSGDSDVGGLVGYNSSSIANSNATGAVSGNSNVGGLVGENHGVVANAYARGSVGAGARPSSNLGGLVGYNSGSITQTYATGTVSGDSDVGGLVGNNSGAVTTSYWDTVTSSQPQGVGANSGAFSATGLTTIQLQAVLPPGFNPLVWGIDPGASYPYLKSLPPTP